MRLGDVPSSPRDRVFLYSPVRALFLVFVVISVSGGLVLIGRQQQSDLAYYIAAVLLLSLLLMRRHVVARLRPSNWLVRMSDEGLLIQFRSYLNYHFPREDLTVVFIPFREIRSTRLVRERRDVPDEIGRESSIRFRRLVKFELAGDSAPLAQALREKRGKPAPKEARWYGSTSTRYNHYPVRLVSPTCLQLKWEVVPSAESFLNAMSRHTDVAAPVQVSLDHVDLERLSREEQEKRLLELAETGEKMAAVKLARQIYSYNLKEAKAFVESLLSGKAIGEEKSKS